MFTSMRFWIISFVIALPCLFLQPAYACTAADDNYIHENFTNGAQWSMCWEFNDDEGIYLTDITYTPPDSNTPFRVINEVNIAQIFVPYDNGQDRFHDVTTYSFGDGIIAIKPQNCANGKLTTVSTMYEDIRGLCQRKVLDTTINSVIGTPSTSEHLLLFSSHQVGAYNYIPEWKFYNNGMIEFAIGATGALETIVNIHNNPDREKKYRKLGWKIDNKTVGVSHVHNYFWRIDFALGDNENDDIVKIVQYKKQGNKIIAKWRDVVVESRFNNKAENNRGWLIQENVNSNKSYHVQPGDSGHRFVGIKKKEAFTRNDLYITKDVACERYASQNYACNNKKQLSDFVQSNASIENKDIVVWYSLSLHHIPRGEESPEMDMHRNSFKLIPKNLY
ncbi:hypothetical protein UA38_12580 [Photobacterium kishitanii]|uniref:Amine oxidase n=1 Tax=Photobacterium kishitanii TaxID=318456 RepID=A0AAX0Z214_9GAMM|nr:hypothetical protein [Photobacterium kishitanii]KJG11303.1 hypothetical protein UB40_01345 [Photobacterium kishitanii]KJG56985.1 hypothetical protein UA38_12580 [Photobacterium kishitanii]KJG62638.1 hypothetical protein UA42_03810 [Photobacterium kishitanii]KJG67006.1 hypothetical protein UA40_05960 [Photobacterium kishitanii]KJG70886.1 hypothetical protein UA41_03450 [Photobacterium kishitanii]